MIVLAVILAVLTLIALLRFGASVEYSASGLAVTVLAGPLSLQVLPKTGKPVSEKKKARQEARKEEKAKRKAEKKAKRKAEKKAREKPGEKKPGALDAALELLPAIKTMLGRLRRRLLIKKLIIHYTAANEDPYKAALTFGAANAVIGTIVPFLENNFRIKKREFRAFANFCDAQQSIYVNAAVSLAIWEAAYMAFALLPAAVKIISRAKGATDRKDGHDNGRKNRQDPNKRIIGNDNAKSQGDDRRQHHRWRADYHS